MHVDAVVARIATRQHGVVDASQCLAIGMTRAQIRHRLRTGRWVEVHRGVYAVGHAALTPQGRYLAAVLAGGPGTLLSHRSAVSLWGLQPHHGGAVHTTSARKQRGRPGIHHHWTRHAPDTRVRQGIPVTSLARTLVDLADVASADELEQAIRAAERLHGFDRAQLRPIHGRRGTRRLTRPQPFTRGHLERLFQRVVAGAGLPAPRMNVPFGPYELDALWPEAKVVVEIDDWATHGTRQAFEADRARDRVLSVAGLRPVRITHEDLTTGSAALVAQFAALGVR
jgi:very-short-patch-repair endonuclease